MFYFDRVFVFLYIFLIGLSPNKNSVAAQKIPSSTVTDDSSVGDDICSSVIDAHPCVKNFLEVLVQKIDLLQTTQKQLIQQT